MSNINWANIQSRINRVVEQLTKQNFCIDVGYALLEKLQKGLRYRNDINVPVIAAYWAKHILNHYELNNHLIESGAVLIEENYYSYLNITELLKSNATTGNTTYVVDFITDSTDLKEGEDLDEWVLTNDFFRDALKAVWMTQVASAWISDNKLVTRKKKAIKIEDYWNYEDYIYTIRVWDPELNIIIVFLLGTYNNY